MRVTGNDAVITVHGLRKTYDGVEAVAGIDLHVSRGEIFAFLGPNGGRPVSQPTSQPWLYDPFSAAGRS
jgi:ABC-type transporter Mla maintaining outer membrane lipid asymmetry ATPase subunit MlaF